MDTDIFVIYSGYLMIDIIIFMLFMWETIGTNILMELSGTICTLRGDSDSTDGKL